ncbi:MAG TPA: hypothetical protein VNP73_00420 [Actinomycetota bacterium]|nr:hypothetical protein [Actinomycetota bacterium]
MLKGTGPSAGLVILSILLLLGAGLYLVLRDDVARLIDRAQSIGDIARPEVEGFTPAYAGVRQLTGDLKAGGMECTDVTVDHEDQYSSIGSCQSSGLHVQINIFLQSSSVQGVEGQLDDDWPFTTVHADNWFVMTETKVARKVHKILGGELFVAADDPFEGTDGGDTGPPSDPRVKRGYKGVRAIIRDINAGGVRCTARTVDQKDDYTSTGSCQVGGTHVQINVYFFGPSIDSVEKSFKDGPFSFVHDDNWFVITQTPVARQIRGALDGRLFVRR